MKGVPEHAKPTWLSRMSDVPLVHHAIARLRIHEVAKRVFTRVPIRLTFRSAHFRIRHLESVLLADEIFRREVYRAAFSEVPRSAKPFHVIDVGSNVGYFICYAHATMQCPLVGLAIDGSEEMVRETEWHLRENGLSEVIAVHGAAGFSPDVQEVTFFVNPSNVASSAQPTLNPNIPKKGDSKPVTVPAAHVLRLWQERFPTKRVDLLKLDVEGSECDFLRHESELLRVTDRVVIEWHKWVTSFEEVHTPLSAAGFTLRTRISEDEHAGVAYFSRDTLSS